MNLSANQERRKVEKKRLDWKVEGTPEEPTVVNGGVVDPVKLVVELAPMEIRTFVIEFDYLKTFASWERILHVSKHLLYVKLVIVISYRLSVITVW